MHWIQALYPEDESAGGPPRGPPKTHKKEVH
jgi:hypothetical protein